ncbi:hypothetical protein ACTJJB_14020 [Chitinophaga sp. 22536]|uniref:hypothetical protein n=1 Tax=unclassified Chitinophaga TaxID=2619133 RepID=UPI003F856234
MEPKNSRRKKMWTDEDISFESPSVTGEQRNETLAAFGKFRQNTKGKVSNEEKLKLRFLQLKFQINEFLKGEHSEYRFGFFLALYMKSLELNGKTFAQEINIKPSLLSQFIHNQREPNDTILMRLEIHSNYNFPADLWYGVLAQQKAIELKNDRSLRKHEETIVKPKVKVAI